MPRFQRRFRQWRGRLPTRAAARAVIAALLPTPACALQWLLWPIIHPFVWRAMPGRRAGAMTWTASGQCRGTRRVRTVPSPSLAMLISPR